MQRFWSSSRFRRTSSQSAGHTVRDAADKIAELWEMPDDIGTRDLFHGAGGADAGAEDRTRHLPGSRPTRPATAPGSMFADPTDAMERQARPRSTDRSRGVAGAVGARLSPAADVLPAKLAALGRTRRATAGGAVSNRFRRREGRRRLVVVGERVHRNAAVSAD